MSRNVRSARGLAAAERRAEIVRLRRDRLTFAEIAAELGMTESGAWRAYQRALDSVPSPAVKQHRQEEIQLADDAVANLIAIAKDPSKHLRYRIEAWQAICRWSERKARLLGLDAPSKRSVEVIEMDTIEKAIQDLERDLVAMGMSPEEVAAIGSGHKALPVLREPSRAELGDGTHLGITPE